MQENRTNQLLRDNYLAEARAQQRHSEMSRSDASSSRLHVYGSFKGKTEDGHGESQLPDLSAFLSQEELDKSVNLARQAIGHDPQEERAEVKASVTQSASASVSPRSPPPVAFANPSPAASAVSSASSDVKDASQRRAALASDAKTHSVIRSSRDSGEFNHLSRSARNAPYGLETQSKKEFLNKAADFIEELSSLFKANSSKRVRPRACKAQRSRLQKNNDGTVYPLSSDNRERPANPEEVEKEGPLVGPPVGPSPDTQPDSGIGHVEFQDCGITEQQQQFDSALPEVEEADSGALTEAPPQLAEEPVCEPPHFILKLKSREVPEGSKVQLDCIVRGRPVPEVR